MKASELIEKLQEAIKEHGDREVVWGMAMTGYGQPVEEVVFEEEPLTVEGEKLPVFDLVADEESLVATGGF
jgi:hypothetical protein